MTPRVATAWRIRGAWYSRGKLLQGKVTLKNCNPLMPARPAGQGAPEGKKQE